MDSKHADATKEHREQPASSSTTEPDPDLPSYYDSEPSSQPPRYDTSSSSKPTQDKPVSRPEAHHSHTGSGASAATIAAILANPSEPESREKRSLRERWKDFKERNFDDPDKYQVDTGSSTQWNAFGASVKGYDKKGKWQPR